MRHDGSIESSRAIIDWTRGTDNHAYIDDDNHYGIECLYLNERGYVHPGNWVVRLTRNRFERLNEEDFRNQYEAA